MAAKKPAPKKAAKTPAARAGTNKPKLLSGGNPQIAKGHGEAPVQAFIDAMPEWKQDVGRRLDSLVTRLVPGVAKAVKWNTPLYGLEQGRWFMGMHVYARYLRVTFFDGKLLDPPPATPSKVNNVSYHDIHEGEMDEKLLAAWIRQAIKLPGEKM
jgi:hypothetical protein